MKILSFVLIILMSINSFAGNTTEVPKIEGIAAAINLDIDNDGKMDLAFLAQPTDEDIENLTLWIKLASDSNYYQFQDFVIDQNGGMFVGLGTHLKANDAGSLQVYSYNDAIGRGRWEETITIAYRKDKLVLAGYTYSQRDTLDLSYSTCDVNLLSKKGIYESSINQGKPSKATFSVAKEDVLNLSQVTSESLLKTYMDNYCNTFDVHENDL